MAVDRTAVLDVLCRCGLEPAPSRRLPPPPLRRQQRRTSQDLCPPPSRRPSSELCRCAAGTARRSGELARAAERVCARRASNDDAGGRRRPSRELALRHALQLRSRQRAGELLVAQAHVLLPLLAPHVGLRGLFALRGACRGLREAVDGHHELWRGALVGLVGPRVLEMAGERAVADAGPLQALSVLLAGCCRTPGRSSAGAGECRVAGALLALGIDAAAEERSLACVASAAAFDRQSRLLFLVNKRPQADLAEAVAETPAHGRALAQVFGAVHVRLLPGTVEAGRALARAVIRHWAACNAGGKALLEEGATGRAVRLLTDERVPPHEVCAMLGAPEAQELLRRFVALFSWKGVPIEGALGMLLCRLQLPADRAVVERVVAAMARRYASANCADVIRMSPQNGSMMTKMIFDLVWSLPEVSYCV